MAVHARSSPFFAPLVNAGLFFLISLPLIFAAFVLSIVAMAKGRVIGGIALLMSLMIVGPGSCEFMINRDKWLHHPEQIEAESRQNLTRLKREKEIDRQSNEGVSWDEHYLATVLREINYSTPDGKVTLAPGLMLDAGVSSDGEKICVIYRGDRFIVKPSDVILRKKK